MKRGFLALILVLVFFDSTEALDIGSIAVKLNAHYSIPVEYTEYVLSHATVVPKVKQFALRVANAPEKVLPFDEFVRFFVNQKRIMDGVDFFEKHKNLFYAVYKRFGVNPCVIISILSIETDLGRIKLKNNCLNSLYSLALYSRRKRYFLYELENYIVYTYRHKIDPFLVKGSITCAIGIPQFMPSNIDKYGVDFNGDGLNLNEVDDAAASVANYLKQHGWIKDKFIAKRLNWCTNRKKRDTIVLKNSKGKRVCFRVSNNFFALKSYNGTINYAIAAYLLSKDICKIIKYR